MTRPKPRTRQQYFNWIRGTVNFTDQWGFHLPLVQTKRTQEELTQSMESYHRVRDAQGNLPIAQVRPRITLAKNQKGRLYADYDGWCNCGYIHKDLQDTWLEVFDLCEEIAEIPHGIDELKIATRIVVYRDAGQWSAAIALGDPQDIMSKLWSAHRRLTREAEIYSTESWAEYAHARYGQ